MTLLLQNPAVEEIHLKELLNLKQGAQRTARAPKNGPLEEGGSPWVLGVWGALWGAGGMRKHAVVSMAISTQDCKRVTAYFSASFLETHCVDITVAAATPHHASPPPPTLFNDSMTAFGKSTIGKKINRGSFLPS